MGEISTVLFLFLFLGSLFVCLFNVFLVLLMLWGDDDVVVVVVVGVFVFSKKSFGIVREREREGGAGCLKDCLLGIGDVDIK